MSQSIMDYIFRRMAPDHLSFDERSAIGIYSADERQRHRETGSYEPLMEETGNASELFEQLTGTAVDSPLCMTCGTKMRPAGSCYVCEGCGSGCS
jgi:ribonucleoside-diphosphate reductase alpha chain